MVERRRLLAHGSDDRTLYPNSNVLSASGFDILSCSHGISLPPPPAAAVGAGAVCCVCWGC